MTTTLFWYQVLSFFVFFSWIVKLVSECHSRWFSTFVLGLDACLVGKLYRRIWKHGKPFCFWGTENWRVGLGGFNLEIQKYMYVWYLVWVFVVERWSVPSMVLWCLLNACLSSRGCVFSFFEFPFLDSLPQCLVGYCSNSFFAS